MLSIMRPNGGKQYMTTCFTWHWKKMCKTNRCPFYRVYKTSSREFKRQDQSILPIDGCSKFQCRLYMSRVIKKPAFRICENKSADQLCSNCSIVSLTVRLSVEQSSTVVVRRFKPPVALYY